MKQQYSLIPKLVTVLREGYSWRTFLSDLNAGMIVGIIAVPLAIAFAIASGLKPEQGLYTALVAGFLISALGGSRFQIGGPTGAFIVIVAGIVSRYGYDGLAAATLIAGVFLIIMGVLRVGSFIKFIPYPVTVGFTSAIAVIIFTSQLKDFLGLDVRAGSADFIGQLAACAVELPAANPWALGIGLFALAVLVYWPRVVPRVPSSLVAIIAGTALVKLFDLPVETIGTRFGDIPHTLPSLRIPVVSVQMLRQLFSPALTIALLAGIESLLSAVVADGMTGRRHRSNAEILAQGVANIGSVLFGGIPATGAIARTATNIKNGAKTPVAGIVHVGTIFLIMVAFGRWFRLIPLGVLSAILIVVAYHMSEWRLFVKLFRSPRSDIALLLATFLLTLLVDLTVAIQMGVILAAFLFMHRMSEVSQTGYITTSLEEEDAADDPNALSRRKVPAGVAVFEIYGTFFFGVVDAFRNSLQQINERPKVFIVRLRHVLAVDATALKALEDLFERTRREGTTLVLAGVHAQPLFAMTRSGLLDTIGEKNVTSHIDHALNRARDLLGIPRLAVPEPFVPTVARDGAADKTAGCARSGGT